jgi:hypothetical protein
MRNASLILATVVAGALALAAAAPAAEPPPGAAMSDSLRYVARVPDSSMIVEGKFDRVKGRDVLVTTGRYGFRTYDVSDPEQPKLLDTFQPPEVLGAGGYWQDEDMELDVRASSSSARSTRATTTSTRRAARASARRPPRPVTRSAARAST